MRQPLLVLTIALMGCATTPTARRFTGADGSPRWYTIECDRRTECVERAGEVCGNGYTTDREDGQSMVVRCNEPTPVAEQPWRKVDMAGIGFDVPPDWKRAKDGLWMSPDQESAALAQSTKTGLNAEQAAAVPADTDDEQWSGTVNVRCTVVVSG